MPAGLEQLHEWLRPWAPQLLSLLYRRVSDDPSDLDVAIDDLIEENAGLLPHAESDLFAGLVAAHLRQVLSALERHGAVRVTVTASTARTADQQTAMAVLGMGVLGMADWAMFDDSATVKLTDLGCYLVRERLLAERATVPLAG